MLRHVRIFRSIHAERLMSTLIGEHPKSQFQEQRQQLEDEVMKKRQPDMPISDLPNPYQPDKKQCLLCKHNIEVDYKNVKLLYQFVSPFTGMLYGRHITGLCEKQQEKVDRAVRFARSAGYMSYWTKEVEFLKDPKLFDAERPIRPHRF